MMMMMTVIDDGDDGNDGEDGDGSDVSDDGGDSEDGDDGQGGHYIRRVYKIGATPTVLLFIKFGLIRLLPWRPLNCAPWLRAIKLKIGMPREHHEFPRLPSARFAAPTGTRAVAVSSRGYLLGLRKSNFKQEWQNKRHEALTRHDT